MTDEQPHETEPEVKHPWEALDTLELIIEIAVPTIGMLILFWLLGGFGTGCASLEPAESMAITVPYGPENPAWPYPEAWEYPDSAGICARICGELMECLDGAYGLAVGIPEALGCLESCHEYGRLRKPPEACAGMHGCAFKLCIEEAAFGSNG